MASSKGDLSLSEIIKRVNIPRQSLIRILNTLCDRGIVDKTDQRGFYRLGMKLLYLGHRIQDKIELRSVALPFMHELAEKTAKTIELSTLDRDQLILIEQIEEGSEGVRLYSRIGSVYPYFHALAVGKIYLAHMDPEKRQKVLGKIGLPAVTEHTITEMNKLEEELLRVQEDGYAFEDQELRKGVRRVVAPIYDFQNDLAGCIGIAATLFSFELEDRDRLGQMAVETASKISRAIGRRE
ncbi:MAG: IclR family transcriptional regulator [Deltaproteobacteria bacterium]|nr:IclR family transcriptional regulator [Deltaproteobacteria bacterium]